ncbi:MAG: ATP synthase F0, C subunit [uncultured bacterium]|nr:MAG: ATP synthase F0, C subunit [uncultured bacterium]
MKSVSFILSTLIGLFITGLAFASGDTATATSGLNLAPIGAGLIMAFASGLGTLAQSKAAAAALEGIARNPEAASKVQTPMIIALAFMESLVIFAFIIAITL